MTDTVKLGPRTLHCGYIDVGTECRKHEVGLVKSASTYQPLTSQNRTPPNLQYSQKVDTGDPILPLTC